MQSNRLTLAFTLALGLLAGSCASSSTPADAGPTTPAVSVSAVYNGDSPSAKAQGMLHSLRGHKFIDRDKRLGGGVWTVGGYMVGETRDGQLQPMVTLSQGSRDLRLPMLTDGDVGYLWSVAKNETSPMEQAQLSAECKSMLRSLAGR
ncbi:MAG: hypothetical protein WD226_00460 [Planctomycetota bacterium]